MKLLSNKANKQWIKTMSSSTLSHCAPHTLDILNVFEKILALWKWDLFYTSENIIISRILPKLSWVCKELRWTRSIKIHQGHLNNWGAVDEIIEVSINPNYWGSSHCFKTSDAQMLSERPLAKKHFFCKQNVSIGGWPTISWTGVLWLFPLGSPSNT